MNEVRVARLRSKAAEILSSPSFSLARLDESLSDSIRRGAKISPSDKAMAMDAAAQIASDAPISDEHIAVLESIVIGNGLRPAFDIVRDSFDALPCAWSDVNAAQEALTGLIRSIGRINVFGNPMLSYVGTAFVCGDNLLMTNRHVVELIMSDPTDGATITFRPGVSSNVDLKQEVASSESLLLELTGRAVVSRTWDAALLEVKALPDGVAPLPMRAATLAHAENRTAAVIGYPAFDPRENLFQQAEIFRSVFNKKRLEPGKFTGYGEVKSFGQTVRALAHDCSTLGGNSGSAAIDVLAVQVFGLHFEGEAASNYAVPTWELVHDDAFAGLRDRMAFV